MIEFLCSLNATLIGTGIVVVFTIIVWVIQYIVTERKRFVNLFHERFLYNGIDYFIQKCEDIVIEINKQKRITTILDEKKMYNVYFIMQDKSIILKILLNEITNLDYKEVHKHTRELIINIFMCINNNMNEIRKVLMNINITKYVQLYKIRQNKSVVSIVKKLIEEIDKYKQDSMGRY